MVKRRKNVCDESSKVIISNMLDDDLLLEIFVRLPADCRDVIRCCLVSKHWFSLINSIQFDNRKQQHYQSKSESLPFTLIFRRHGFQEFSKPLLEYLPKKSQILHRFNSSSLSISSTYLEFLPWQNVYLLASINDLLLFSPDMKIFMICNPMTRQWLELPHPYLPANQTYLPGLLVCQNDEQQQQLKIKIDQCSYRVMLIRIAHVECWSNGKVDFVAITFCSETKKWSESTFSFRGKLLQCNPSVASNGRLHWLEGNAEDQTLCGIVAFDPFKDANHPKFSRFIDFPLGFLHGLHKSNILTVRLGIVRGQLRLSQIFKNRRRDDYHVLKVWELNYDKITDDDDDVNFRWAWSLVHDIKLKRCKSKYLVVLTFHPHNGNVIFLLSNCYHIYQYNIGEDKMRKVGKLPDDDDDPRFLWVYTLVHPLWPTTI